MAYFRGDIYSQALGMQTGIHVILPDGCEKNSDLRVLYLLHGLSDNCSNWAYKTGIARYAIEYRTAVIMPEVQRSFYTDMRCGPRYFTYVAKELPEICQKIFGLSDRREQNMVAGLSMGGYGAMKCALSFPERYGYCAAFSSACDIHLRTGNGSIDPNYLRDLKGMFGESLEVPEASDLHKLAEKNAPAAAPRMFLTCGLEDSLLPENREMADILKKLAYDVHYEEWTGDHTWEFWDASIQKAFRYFFGEQGQDVVRPVSAEKK